MHAEPEQLKISDIMTPVKEFVLESMQVTDLPGNNRLNDLGVLLVVDASGNLVGAIREREVLTAQTKSTAALKASDIMIPIKESLTPTSSLHDANQLLINSKLRFVVVTDNHKPVGIVWTDSALAALTNSYREKYEQWRIAQTQISYRDEFLGILVHDLRSPLGAITACCDLIKMGSDDLPKSHTDLLDTIKKNAYRCIDLATDLLDFGKLNSGMTITLDVIDAHAVLDEITSNLKLIGSQEYGVHLKTIWCEPVNIKIDRGRFSEIIDNLVINAFKVTPKGKTVTIKTDLIDDFKRNNKSLRIQISDEGPGIPRDKISSIFDKYTQLDSKGARSGVGLGLSIVAQFVRLHNGEIHVDGGHGSGATFSIYMPNAEIIKTISLTSSASGKRKVLVVDDDDAIRNVIAACVSNLAEVRTAADGVEGYAIFESWDPDLILSDVKMPAKNGIELLNDVKHASPGTPVVLISGALDAFGTGEIKSSLKPDAYLPKPFVTADLINIVNKLLNE